MIYRTASPASALDNRVLPVSLQDFKDQMRIEHADQDRLLVTKVQAAVAEIEKILTSAIIARDFVLNLANWPTEATDETDKILIPNPPLQSVTSIQYRDSDDAVQTLDPVNYRVSNVRPQPYIELASGGVWPEVYGSGDSIAVNYSAGWATSPGEVPFQLREAILLRASTRMEMGVEAGLGTAGWSLPMDVAVMSMLVPFLRPSV